jgi:eukaryotic-like serine/threonine-protein kinase
VYALGVVVFELLTGRVPFEGDNFVAVAMRHVSETPPSVLELRPDTPVRLANAVDRALEKAPEYRFPTMGAFVDEMELCLAELDGEPDAGATMVVRRPATAPARPERVPRRRRARRSVWPALLLVVGLLALAGVVALALLTDDPVGEVRERTPGVDGGGGGGGGAAEGPIELSGIRAYDPFGDNQQEHDEDAPAATDDDPSTDWATEGYTSGLQKEGVGLVLDAGREVEPAELTVHTSSNAFTAEIRAGASPTGPFETVVAGSQQVDGEATFELDGEPARYYVVWITELDGRARITEVTANT